MAADMSCDSFSAMGDSSLEDVCLTPHRSPDRAHPLPKPSLATSLFSDPFEDEQPRINTPPTLKRPLFQTTSERPKKRRKSQEPPFLSRPTRFLNSTRRPKAITSRFEEEYTDREKIGSGSFGQVFKCTHGKSRETFAIKKIDVSKRDTGAKEVQALIDTRGSPYIVSFIHDWREEDINGNTSLFICFEFSSLGDLSTNLIKGKSQNEVQLMDILHDVTDGLRHLHSKNYIHCDIKPANIIKFPPSPGSSRPIYKISDLGLALRCGDGGAIQSSEGDGDGKYVAPEVLGQRIVSQKADVYSLGMSIIELGRGELFPSRRGEEWQKMKHSFQLGQFGFMASSGFVSVVKRMIDPDFEKRPSSELLAKQLKTFLPPKTKMKPRTQRIVKGVSCPNTVGLVGENSVMRGRLDLKEDL